MTSNEKCQGCERYILNQRGEYHCMLGECVVEKAKNMPILDKLYARYEASMVCYYENINERFKGEAEAYQDCIKLIEPIVERLEILETSVLEYKDQEQLYWQTNENNVKLRDENEKLKKAIENEIELLIERRFNAYACDNYEIHSILNTIIEELREVLSNE